VDEEGVLSEFTLNSEVIIGGVAKFKEMHKDAGLKCSQGVALEREVRVEGCRGRREVLKDEEVRAEAEADVVREGGKDPFSDTRGGHAKRERGNVSGIKDGVEGVEGRV
jgi:hypothetical protein